MNKKLIIKIASVMAIACCSLGSVFTWNSFNGMADVKTELESFLEETYVKGDIANIPNRLVDGKELQKIVYAPSGQAYAGNSIKLNEAGYWTIGYVTEDGLDEYRFFVNTPMFSFNGDLSNVSLGLVSDYTQYSAGGASGAIAKIYPNEILTYNKPIDLTNHKQGDTIIEFSLLPNVQKTADAAQLYITLTDVYDPENVVTFRFNKAVDSTLWDNEYAIWLQAAAPGQEGKGMYGGGLHTHEGFSYEYIWTGFEQVYGTQVDASMSAYPLTHEEVGSQKVRVSMDYENRYVFVNDRIVIDLDAPLLQERVWEGFTDGRCLLSVYADKYNSTDFNLLIRNIDGDSDLNKAYLDNDKVPEIQLVNYHEDNVDKIIVNKPFPIPEAIAYDAFATQLSYSYSVYTAYGTSGQVDVPIKDGYFIPTKERNYYIVYKCEDAWGNIGEKVIKLEATKDYTPMALNLVGEKTVECSVGQSIAISDFAVSNFIGQYDVVVKARNGETEILLAKYPYGAEKGPCYFKPMELGTWEIVYECSDFYVTTETSYEIEVTSDNQVIIDEANVPYYIIKGATYKAPELWGYDFTSGKGVAEKAKLFVSDSENYSAEDEVKDATFVWWKNTEKVVLTYVLGSAKKSYEIKVIDATYGMNTTTPLAYFYGAGDVEFLGIRDTGIKFTLDKENSSYPLSFINCNEEYAIGFINKVQTYDFSFSFKVPEDQKYDRVNLYLTDASDKNNVLKVSYYVGSDDKLYFSVNDGREAKYNGEWTDEIIIAYQVGDNAVTCNEIAIPIETNYNGEEWKGFSENFAWLTLTTSDSAEAKIIICSINAQKFYDYRKLKFMLYDENPQIYQDKLAGDKAINTEMIISPICASDVFSVGTTVSLTVVAPNGKIATAKDGTQLDGVFDLTKTYSIVFDSYGVYKFSYTVEDEFGKVTPLEYNVNIVDMDAPSVEINKKQVTARVGDTIKLAAVSVQDDCSAVSECTVSIYIQDPNDYFTLSDAKTSYVFEKAGYYTVWYYVTDKAGNSTITNYKIFVS